MDRPNRHSRKGLRRVRERAIKAVGVRIRASGLADEEVFPVQGVRRSWRSRAGFSLLQVYEFNPEVTYTHEKPFTASPQSPEKLERLFSSVIDLNP